MFTTMPTAATSTERPTFQLSAPNVMLRLEGLALFIAVIVAYIHFRGSGLLFAALILAPDLSFLAYLINTRIGAWVYNIAHHIILPLILTALALSNGDLNLLRVALIWFAHIGMDRVAGYGFKYSSAFKDTHMGRV